MSLPRGEDSRVVSVSEVTLSNNRARRFVIGANEEDGNVALKPSTTYAFYIRWIAQGQAFGNRLESSPSLPLLYTMPAAINSHNPAISDSCSATSTSTTAAIAVLVCLLIISTSAAIYFASNNISLRKRCKQENAAELKTMDISSTQDTRHVVYEDVDCPKEHAMTDSRAYGTVNDVNDQKISGECPYSEIAAV
jgi:hypothetical protein